MDKNIKTMNEKELSETEVLWPKTQEGLIKYINNLVERKHDYGTCVYAMSMSAVATFNYVAGVLGVTGFQASCADLDFLKRTRRMDLFSIVNYDDFLYPQYEDSFNKTISKDTWKAIQDKAQKAIKKANAEYAQYLIDLEKYESDIATFVAKYPDYYERRKYYDPLVMGSGAEWDKEEKKKKTGFEFAPQAPYCPVNSDSEVYKHWMSIVNGKIPFGYSIGEK